MTIASGAVLNGNGRIIGDVSNAGILAPGASIGTLTIEGNYVHEAGARLVIEFDAAPSNDLLSVTGDITLLGGTVEFHSLGGGDGAAISFMQWGGSLTGAFDQVISPGGGAVAISYGDNSVGGREFEDGYVEVAGAGAESIIRTFVGGGGASAIRINNAFATLGSSGGSATVVLSARPSTPNAQAAMLQRTTAGFLDVVFAQVQREDSAVWGRGFSDDLTRQAVGDSRGFEYASSGAINGVHRVNRSGVSLGFALGASRDEAVLEASSGRSEGEGVFGAVYMGWQGEQNFAAAGLALSTQRIDVDRVVQESGAALGRLEAETDGRSLALFGSAGRRFDVFDWSLVASGEFAYLATATSAYEEGGVSALRVAFDDYETQSITGSLSLFGEHRSRLGGLPMRARLGARWSREAALDDRAVGVAFSATGGRATLQGDKSNRAVLHGIAGLTLDVSETMELSGDVALARGDEERNAITVGARWRF
jgi:subtilase-type serine protease